MSSSRRKEVHLDQLELNEPFPCAICGEQAVKRVKGNCKLLDGTIIRGLSRFRCAKCGENFFDAAAMKEIRRQRRAQANGEKAVRRLPANRAKR
jgi:predicted RNA-binding Zn-ribbon protein involved in translation (DUF1610 family)